MYDLLSVNDALAVRFLLLDAGTCVYDGAVLHIMEEMV